MRNRSTWMVSGALAVGALGLCSTARASSHREAPAIADDPAADNADLYAWVQGSNLVIVADYDGLELPEGGPNWAKFSDDVLYEIHIVHGGTSLADALTYQFQFTTAKPTYVSPGSTSAPFAVPTPTPAGGNEFFAQLTGSGAFHQTFTVTQLTAGASPTVIATNVAVPPPNVGPETNKVAYKIPVGKTYENFFVDPGNAANTIGTLTSTGGGSVFAGPRDDPFFVDLGAVLDLAQLRPVANGGEAARDSIAYMNVHAIVLQIPVVTANLNVMPTATAGNAAQTIGVWASASRRKVTIERSGGGGNTYLGPWVQVSRLGLPLINEAVIGVQDKDYWNHTTPAEDLTAFGAYFLNPVVVRDAQAITFYGTGEPLAGCSSATPPGSDLTTDRSDIITTINDNIAGITTVGDVLRVDLSSGATPGFPNGRLLTDDVVATELGLLLCGASKAGALAGKAGPTANEPEAVLPKMIAGVPTFPYLAPPWEGRSANPRPVPSLP